MKLTMRQPEGLFLAEPFFNLLLNKDEVQSFCTSSLFSVEKIEKIKDIELRALKYFC